MNRTVTYEFEKGDMVATTIFGYLWVAIRVAAQPVGKTTGLNENNEWRGTDGSFHSDATISNKLEVGNVAFIGNIREHQGV